MRIIALMFVLVACEEAGVEPEVGPAGASRVETGCAPDDGPAFELIIGLDEATCEADAGAAPLRFTLEGDAPDAPGTVEIDDQSALQGSIAYRPDGEAQLGGAHSATIAFDRWDDAIEGSYELRLEDGRVLIGTFDAPALCATEVECG